MKTLLFLTTLIAFTSCIPYKIAPKFNNQGYKIVKGKKFHKKLDNRTSFVFEDPKKANEFYDYINAKFNLNHKNVGVKTPFTSNRETYYLSYYEVERTDENLVLPLVLVDLKRSSNGNEPLFENNYTLRKGHWYIILTVYDNALKNCLLDNHPKQSEIINYLKNMKAQYLNTSNYNELYFEKKS